MNRRRFLKFGFVATAAAALGGLTKMAVSKTQNKYYGGQISEHFDGTRFFNPAYKPGWSPDLLRCTMYIGHLTTYRASLIKEVGGFRPLWGQALECFCFDPGVVGDEPVHGARWLGGWILGNRLDGLGTGDVAFSGSG